MATSRNKTLRQRIEDGTSWDGDCLLWTGTALMPDGYARFTYRGKKQLVHRVVWEDANGPIPDGWQVDHVAARGCRHRNCVNIDHLEAVPPGENTRRASILNERCRSGRHVLAEVGVLSAGRGGRTCAACSRESAAKYRERVRAGIKPRPRTIITDDQVAEIRQEFATTDVTKRALAERYGVSAAHMGRIINGRLRNNKEEGA